MNEMTDLRENAPASRTESPALPIDESRLAMMRRVKRMPLEERIALLDRMCREGTHIATRARRIK